MSAATAGGEVAVSVLIWKVGPSGATAGALLSRCPNTRDSLPFDDLQTAMATFKFVSATAGTLASSPTVADTTKSLGEASNRIWRGRTTGFSQTTLPVDPAP